MLYLAMKHSWWLIQAIVCYVWRRPDEVLRPEFLGLRGNCKCPAVIGLYN